MPIFRRYSYAIILLGGLFSFTAHAAFTPQEVKDLRRVEQHLNQTKTFSASFSQTATDGSTANGNFYLERPGKLRWQYTPPNPVTIVLRDGMLAYYDAELDELSHIPIDNAVAGFLIQEKISLLESDALTVAIERKESYHIVTITNKETVSDGFLRLLFEDKDSALTMKELEYRDPIGVKTAIVFDNIKYNTALEDNVFSIERHKRFRR
jgi:outer membrane lipoprotein-sorting protein